jgi:DNA mismatch repair protein MutH
MPPASERELLARARELAGYTVGELAARLAVALPAQSARAKGLAGQLVERALGASARQPHEPDFPELGIELKTIPLGASGRPRESTFVCGARLRAMAESEWESSEVARKLGCVLWVPIEAGPAPLGARRIGAPRLWRPSTAQLAVLRADWEQIASVIGRGDVELLDARTGRWLQLRPKAASSRTRGRGIDERGAPLRTLPRGFYLRAVFTAEIFK